MRKGRKYIHRKGKGRRGGRRKTLCGIMNEEGGQRVCCACLCAYMYVCGGLIIDSMCYRRKLLARKRNHKRSESKTEMRGVL